MPIKAPQKAAIKAKHKPVKYLVKFLLDSVLRCETWNNLLGFATKITPVINIIRQTKRQIPRLVLKTIRSSITENIQILTK